MALIEKILYPVDFSPACAAMAAYVKRAAAILGANVSLVYVADLASWNGFELYMRPAPVIEEEHLSIARERLNEFLAKDFPVAECPRILAAGDVATKIAQVAREGKFDLIMMPTYSGIFRRMLLGSTTAKVLNDADSMILTSMHAKDVAPRPLEHRQWLCAIGLGATSERVLRYASQVAKQAHSKLTIIHAVQAEDPDLPIALDVEQQVHSVEREEARRRIDELQQRVGSDAEVRISVGPIKDALLEAARQSDADALIIGRTARDSDDGRMRDLIYAMVRDSPFPVVTV